MSSSQNIYVAVIGGDESLCRSLDRSLRAAHLQPITYPSAEAFLADTKRPNFDCLVIDIQVGGMSGLELSQRLSAVNKGAPTVFLTTDDAPFGWFGRFGFGGSQVTAGAAAQVGTGVGMRGPLAYTGLFPSRKDDNVGIGFVWSQPSWSASPAAHQNEYVMEAGYVLQVTPFARLQPDLQMVWNPANNPNASHALVLQLQLEVAW
jgi:hypothetical protein